MSDLSRDEVRAALAELVDEGLAEARVGDDGEVRYWITDEGEGRARALLGLPDQRT